eukprot:scaffold26652_cov126-Isochrysis_galbana.AAC.1
MAPRQLLLELEEVDMAAEKGSKRVRVDRADESSTQVRLPLRATARFTSLPCHHSAVQAKKKLVKP